MDQCDINRHKNMASQLGMPKGTAANRLRKLVLFDVLKRHNENICYRCNQQIESVDELSIEHKEPWENRDAALFWDMRNIAFSHLLCNIRAARPGALGKPSHRRITPPNGTAWCRSCNKFLPVENFSKHNQNWNGIRRDCRKCSKEYKDKIRGNIMPDSVIGNTSLSESENSRSES